MAIQTETIAIIGVETAGLTIYSATSPTPIQVPFPAGCVVHMEVENSDAFHSLIASVCAQMKLDKVFVILVLGKSMTFEKQIPILTEEKLEEELQHFRDATPFDRVAGRAYKLAQGSTLITTNRDFFDSLRQSLERGGARVVGVIPPAILNSLVGAGGIQPKNLRALSSKIDEIANQSVVTGKLPPKSLQQQEEYFSKQYSVPLVVGFVLFLFLIFGGTALILRSQFQAARPKATPVVSSLPPSIPTTDTASAAATPAQSNATISAILRITIIRPVTAASQAAALRQKFIGLGYTDVKEKIQNTLQVAKPFVQFLPATSTLDRNQILQVLHDQLGEVATQDTPDLGGDVWITIGK